MSNKLLAPLFTAALALGACAARGPAFEPVTTPERMAPVERPYSDEAAPGPFWADQMPPDQTLAANGRLAIDLQSGRTEFVPGSGWRYVPGAGWRAEPARQHR